MYEYINYKDYAIDLCGTIWNNNEELQMLNIVKFNDKDMYIGATNIYIRNEVTQKIIIEIENHIDTLYSLKNNTIIRFSDNMIFIANN